jgi:hypothetical protein
MNLSDVELPSNRKFGFFFTAIFWAAAAYAFYVNSTNWLYILGAIGVVFFVVTILKADTLLPLNKLWMKFGLLLGMIVSPIVMGVIFFVIFSPIAILMRLFGRDELRLRFKKQATHWISRVSTAEYDSFKNQF